MEKFKFFNLIGDVNEKMEYEFSLFCEEMMAEPDTSIVISINSLGGSLVSALSIYNKIRALPNTVFTLITNKCHSAANIIALAVPYSRRFAFNYSTFLMHPTRRIAKEQEVLTTFDYKEDLKDLNEYNTLLYEIIKAETAIPEEVLKNTFFPDSDPNVKIHCYDFEENKIAHIINRFDDIYTR